MVCANKETVLLFCCVLSSIQVQSHNIFENEQLQLQQQSYNRNWIPGNEFKKKKKPKNGKPKLAPVSKIKNGISSNELEDKSFENEFKRKKKTMYRKQKLSPVSKIKDIISSNGLEDKSFENEFKRKKKTMYRKQKLSPVPKIKDRISSNIIEDESFHNEFRKKKKIIHRKKQVSTFSKIKARISSNSMEDESFETIKIGKNCGGVFSLKADQVLLLMPDINKRDPSCKWEVSVEEGNNLSIQCPHFNLKGGEGCKEEKLILASPDGEKNTYCGSSFPAVLDISSSTTSISLLSKASKIGKKKKKKKKACPGQLLCIAYATATDISKYTFAKMSKKKQAIDMSANEIGVVYSSYKASSLISSVSVKTALKNELLVSCPKIDFQKKGCKQEILSIRNKNKKFKRNFCHDINQDYDFPVRTLNPLEFSYRRKKKKKADCSSGFICFVRLETADVSLTVTPTNKDPLTISMEPLKPRHFCENCGRSTNSDLKIVGGIETGVNEFPWMVQIRMIMPSRKLLYCGGTLIKKKWLLSAAHCFKSRGYDKLIAIFGEHNYDLSDESSIIELEVKTTIVHPEYNTETWENDIALLELPMEQIFLSYVHPICLGWPEDVRVGEKATVIGWGHTEWAGEYSSTLRKVEVEVISNDRCKNLYPGSLISHNMICAYTSNKDACQGDSGGPLMVIRNGTWMQIGIVSFGYKCAEPNSPGGYNRVPNFIDWISQTTGSSQC